MLRIQHAVPGTKDSAPHPDHQRLVYLEDLDSMRVVDEFELQGQGALGYALNGLGRDWSTVACWDVEQRCSGR